MEIIDKYGYLEDALEYIEKNLVSGRGLRQIAKKTGISDDKINNLSSALRGFSEKMFFTILKQEIEDRHSSIDGADAEISGVDISIVAKKNNAFVLMKLVCDIVADGEKEDKIKMDVRLFSKIDVRIS